MVFIQCAAGSMTSNQIHVFRVDFVSRKRIKNTVVFGEISAQTAVGRVRIVYPGQFVQMKLVIFKDVPLVF